MKKQWTIAASFTGVVALAAAGAFYLEREHSKQAHPIDPSNRTLVDSGKAIYTAHCAACHGSNLQGQAQWRTRLSNGRLPAPPHDETGHTWHHPDRVLVDIVKNGLVPGKTAPTDYQSDMPAYRDILSDSEIHAVLAYIKSTWPREIQDIQKELTRQKSQ